MLKVFPFRLLPDQDLKTELIEKARREDLKASVLISGIGSLAKINIRLANSNKTLSRQGKYEIVSLAGTISSSGCHIHISVADEEGLVFGGHLLEGNIIFTTAEVALLECENFTFNRELDPQTSYLELKIKQNIS